MWPLGDSFGQQAPVFTQYKDSYMFINPAYAGMRQGICVNGLMRQQWAGFKDYETGDNAAPENYLVTIDSPIKFLHGGIGGTIIQDKPTYNWNDISLLLSYSFHAELSVGSIGIGVGAVLKNRSIDGSKYRYVDEDPIILKSEQGDMRFDANLGVFFKSNNNYYIGISLTNLINSRFVKLDPAGDGLITTDRTLYITGGYNYILPRDPRFEIDPSFLIQSDFISTQYNISATVNYNSRFLAGLNYRFQESVGIMVGMRYKDFRLGYAYDANTKRLNVPGSHEISLNYCFKIKPDRSKTSYKNTRYL
ncbi:MAG: type IX secretion system membrane protein PorP/SprF [Bacteroidales bacterium]|nr:type IX secretion system membrane protein PorP/SprF [Bacteroidales bacterium]